MSLLGRVFCQVGQGNEQRAQLGISQCFGGGPQVRGGVRRGWAECAGFGVGCRDRYHFGGDRGRRQAKSARGVEDGALIHACARGPDRRFDQEQDAVIAQRDVLDVVAQWRRQQRDEPPAQQVKFARARGQVGDRRALRQRRRTVGIAGWQWLGRRQR